MDTEDTYHSDGRDHDEEPGDEDLPQENPEEILASCLQKFGSSDFIMEPEIFTQLKTYFQAGGNPEQVRTSLANSR